MDQRMDVLELFFSIDVVNHYDLLGVPQDADRKAIKQAYFERATVLHPDRFFGKNIGSYRSRIERVFTASHQGPRHADQAPVTCRLRRVSRQSPRNDWPSLLALTSTAQPAARGRGPQHPPGAAPTIGRRGAPQRSFGARSGALEPCAHGGCPDGSSPRPRRAGRLLAGAGRPSSRDRRGRGSCEK